MVITRLLLCIDTRTGLVNRYVNRKCVNVAQMHGAFGEYVPALELFRRNGAANTTPSTKPAA